MELDLESSVAGIEGLPIACLEQSQAQLQELRAMRSWWL
jgi:hypothetical protein